MQGVVAFVLSLMGFSPITRLTLAGSELRCESTSLFGQRTQLIPIRQVANLAAGIHKPIGNLIWAAVINVAGALLSWKFSTHWPITINLVAGIALVVNYAISKKFFVEIHSQGGPPISLLFTPNILEGVPINIDSAMAVIGVIRDLVMASGNTSMGAPNFAPSAMQPPFGGYGGTIPPAPAPPSAPWPSSIADPDHVNPDTFPVPTKQIHDSELSEVVTDLVSDETSPDEVESVLRGLLPAHLLESYKPSPDEIEAAAQVLLSNAKELAATGNRRKAIEILKAILSECPDTQAAQKARKTLARIGIDA